MSLETALARAQAEACERDWKQHRQMCPTCSAAARARRWVHLCDRGASLYDFHREAQHDLAENRRLDKLPAPDQGALFDV